MITMLFAPMKRWTVMSVSKSKHTTAKSDRNLHKSSDEKSEILQNRIIQYIESRGSPDDAEQCILLAEKETHSPPSHEEPVIFDLLEYLAVFRDLRGKAPPDTAINVRGAPGAAKTTTSDSLRLPFELIPQGRNIKELSFSDTIRPG